MKLAQLRTRFSSPLAPSPAVTWESPDPMKERTLDGFGDRLAELRQRRGLTQTALGAAVGVSKRVIALLRGRWRAAAGCDARRSRARPARLSRRAAGPRTAPRHAEPQGRALLKRIERGAELPDAEQRAVLKVVDGFLDSFSLTKPRRRAAPPPRPKRKAS